jgi:hypothetical protein
VRWQQKTKSRQGFERGRKAREITPRMPSGMRTHWHVTSQRSHPIRDAVGVVGTFFLPGLHPIRDAPLKKQNRRPHIMQAAVLISHIKQLIALAHCPSTPPGLFITHAV